VSQARSPSRLRVQLGTLFSHRDASLANAWRMQLGGPAADVNQSGTPYVAEPTVPKA
jgi:hypothetical protein